MGNFHWTVLIDLVHDLTKHEVGSLDSQNSILVAAGETNIAYSHAGTQDFLDAKNDKLHSLHVNTEQGYSN